MVFIVIGRRSASEAPLSSVQSAVNASAAVECFIRSMFAGEVESVQATAGWECWLSHESDIMIDFVFQVDADPDKITRLWASTVRSAQPC